MHDKHLFEYAIIRLVPKVEREEFLNVGVIMYCKSLQFLSMQYALPKARIHSFSPFIMIDEIQSQLAAFELICRGGPGTGPIGQLDLPSRFRWLTATRSTVLQVSKVHAGFCSDAKDTISKLHQQLVDL